MGISLNFACLMITQLCNNCLESVLISESFMGIGYCTTVMIGHSLFARYDSTYLNYFNKFLYQIRHVTNDVYSVKHAL